MARNGTQSNALAHFPLRAWQLSWYALITILGLLGNFVVCYVILKGRREVRSNSFNVLLFGLSLTDLALSVVLVPIYVLTTSLFHHPSGNAGDWLCKTVTSNFIPFFLAHVSVYILVAISLERQRALEKPIVARFDPKVRSIKAIALSYVVAFVIQVPTLFGAKYTSDKATYGNFCTFAWSPYWVGRVLYTIVFTCQLVIPFFIFLFVLWRTRRKLKSMEDGLVDFGIACSLIQQQAFLKKKKRTIRIVIVLIVAFFVCWTPNNIAYFIYQFFPSERLEWDTHFYQLTILLGMSSAFINPFLYAFQSSEFRRHCRRVFFQSWDSFKNRRAPDSNGSHGRYTRLSSPI